MRWVLFIVLMSVSSWAWAGHKHTEDWYVQKWCPKKGGVIEYRLPNSTRVDCLTEHNAIEFDFVRKFYEAVGQSLFYAMFTGRRAMIALIIEDDEKDLKYYRRAWALIDHYGLPIDVWPVREE